MGSHDSPRERKAANTARRAEQVRHLVRSVGVEMDNGDRLPYFVELAPGRFRPNPALRSVATEDDRLCTLPVASDTPAKIPSDGLPLPVLKYLIGMGLRGGDSL
jgi:hypothetical protein